MKPTPSYFGHPTFQSYYSANNKRGHCYENTSMADAWKSIERVIELKIPNEVAEFLVNEVKAGKSKQIRPIWYFLMPETRASINPELLAVIDEVMVIEE